MFQQPKGMHIYDYNERKLSTVDLIKVTHDKTWTQALSNEWRRLAKGNNNCVLSTDTIKFIEPSKVPTGKQVTHIRFVHDHRHPQDRVAEMSLISGRR